MTEDIIEFPGGDTDDLGERLMKTDEVAEHLQVHPETLYRLEPEKLPYIVVNGRGDRRYRPSDVRAYLESRTVRESREAS